MFDYISNEIFCPICGAKHSKDIFQTKSFSRSMNSLDITKIRGIEYNIYASCRNCNNWIEILISSHSGIHTEEEGQKQIKKRQREISKMFSPAHLKTIGEKHIIKRKNK